MKYFYVPEAVSLIAEQGLWEKYKAKKKD